MKTKEQLAELILDMFRAANCKVGHIVMMRVFKHKVMQTLNPKEQEQIIEVANRLIANDYMKYEDPSTGIECLRLTEKGYDYIYDDSKQLDIFDEKEDAMLPKNVTGNTTTKKKTDTKTNTPTVNYQNTVSSNRMINTIKPIYKVFVSSTYQDLVEERIKVMTTIVQCGHLPIGMEQFPAAPIEAWDYIKMLIDNADYYLLLLAGKYGSVHPVTGISYTQMEYEYAKEKNVPIIFLTYKDVENLPLKKSETDAATKDLLEKFRKNASSNLRQIWTNIDDLAYKVKDSLERSIEICPRIGWVRADSIVPSKSVSLEDIDVNEKFTITVPANPFIAEEPKSIVITLGDFMLSAGSVLKEFAQYSQIRDCLRELINMDYKILDDIMDHLLSLNLIERGQVNNPYEGTYRVWSFTQKGLELYLKLKKS